ncbi:uncharacterized protein LOC122813990 [Protopterus annectens]|uniref:uncharacterized protein LOC122813990 n=1 Tax=Protopterus annectens TaxID=7888 RepID=UPI001CFAF3B5|nr:uncharacterized protein LOC122813990 [Protopterus annectens]
MSAPAWVMWLLWRRTLILCLLLVFNGILLLQGAADHCVKAMKWKLPVFQSPDEALQKEGSNITINCTFDVGQCLLSSDEVYIKWSRKMMTTKIGGVSHGEVFILESMRDRLQVRWEAKLLTSFLHLHSLLINDSDIYDCEVTIMKDNQPMIGQGYGTNLTVVTYDVGLPDGTTSSKPSGISTLLLYFFLCRGLSCVLTALVICTVFHLGWGTPTETSVQDPQYFK